MSARIKILTIFSVLFLALPSCVSAQSVSITFDDGFASTYSQALPVLSQRGIKATSFITTGFVDSGMTGDGIPAMNWNQVQALQNQYGWEIGSHTVTHPELPTISATKIKTELNNSKNTLISKGFNVTSFATPFGAYNNIVLTEALKIYNVHRGFWDRDALNPYPADRSVIMVQSVESGVSVATVKSWIDQALQQKKWLVLVFHDVAPQLNPSYEYTTTTSDLAAIADYIKQTGIKVVLMNSTLEKPGANLIPNSTFVSGLGGGWSTTTGAQVIPNSGNNGSYPSPIDSIKLIGSTSAAVLSSPKIGVNPTGSYIFQSFVNSDAVTSGQINFSVEEYSGSNSLLGTKSLGNIPADSVRIFSANYKPSSNSVTSIKIKTTLAAKAKGTAYVDNYELYGDSAPQPTSSPTPIPSVTPTPTSTPIPTMTPSNSPTPTPSVSPSPNINLVQNNSFETLTSGWASNWTKDGTNFSIDTTNKGDNGANSLHLTPNSVYAHAFSSKMSVDAAITYQWKEYIKATGTGEFGFYIDEYDTNGNWISGQWKGMISGSFTGMKQFSYKPSSTNVKTAALQYYATPNSTFDLYLDSVYLGK